MRRTLTLTAQQRAELERLRNRAPKAYLRERAAALLKIADGAIPSRVARDGLLRSHHPDTIYDWLNRFEHDGIAGLTIRPGRGRKPSAPQRSKARSRRAPGQPVIANAVAAAPAAGR